jgi:hypothetical protein
MSRIQSNTVLRSTILFASLLMVVIVGGCTPYSTYPPVAKAEVQVPWMYPMPQVMAKALRTTFDKTSPPLEAESGRPMLVYALPEGISERVWRQVGIDTGSEGAREWNEADLDAGTPIWSIEQVRIRNKRAEVDVIFPVSEGYERATVILEALPLAPYQVKFFQRWRVAVDTPVFSRPKDQPPADDDSEPVSQGVAESPADDSGSESDSESAESAETATTEASGAGSAG